MNKPTGVVCTSSDPAGRPRVIDLLPPDSPRTFCVGRLDMETEGLILVTNDGELANGLTHPRHGVEKIYQVQVAGKMERAVLAAQGRHSPGRGLRPREARSHQEQPQRSTILEMVLDEGRNREVRRLLATVGHKVQRLRRIAVGPVRLGELPSAAGEYRALTREEVQALRGITSTGGRSSKPRGRKPPAGRRRPGTSAP